MLTVPDENHNLYPFSMNLLYAGGSQPTASHQWQPSVGGSRPMRAWFVATYVKSFEECAQVMFLIRYYTES